MLIVFSMLVFLLCMEHLERSHASNGLSNESPLAKSDNLLREMMTNQKLHSSLELHRSNKFVGCNIFRSLALLLLSQNPASSFQLCNLKARTELLVLRNEQAPSALRSSVIRLCSLPADVEVAIAGGGLGGLSACAALRARGINAHVFEGEPTLLRGSTGTGIMISANGFGALKAINSSLPALMRERGARITRQSVHKCEPTGEEVRVGSMNATKYLDMFGAEQYNVGWARVHEILASTVPSHVVHCGCKLTSYTLTPEGNAVNILFEDGRSVRAPLLVGADGVGSAVRRFVANDAACKTRYNGQLLWNAILPSSDVPNAHGPGEVEFVTCGTDGQAILAFDAGEGQTSWYLTLMETNAPPKVRAALESSSFGGFGRVGVVEELKQVFAPWPLAVECLQATPESQIFERRLADRSPLMQWADTGPKGGGRVVLMGDAAHPMVPSQGQGTMLTWEDAADLAAYLTKFKNRQDSFAEGVPAAVKAFVAHRAKRCAMVQRFSAQTYMGWRQPTFFPLKFLSGLKRMSKISRIYGGYKPID